VRRRCGVEHDTYRPESTSLEGLPEPAGQKLGHSFSL
jgi:hypothetical protein